MNLIIRNPITLVWALLVAGTISTGWLAESHRGVHSVSVIIALIVFVKVFLIMQYFMELKSAPIIWRFVMGGWLTIATAVVISGAWID